jgi:hypothetical protein
MSILKDAIIKAAKKSPSLSEFPFANLLMDDPRQVISATWDSSPLDQSRQLLPTQQCAYEDYRSLSDGIGRADGTTDKCKELQSQNRQCYLKVTLELQNVPVGILYFFFRLCC